MDEYDVNVMAMGIQLSSVLVPFLAQHEKVLDTLADINVIDPTQLRWVREYHEKLVDARRRRIEAARR